MPKMRYFLINL